MTNIQRLANEGGKNHRLFASTIVDLANAQGCYLRLYQNVNALDEDAFKSLFDILGKQSFRDNLDVIFWLES